MFHGNTPGCRCSVAASNPAVSKDKNYCKEMKYKKVSQRKQNLFVSKQTNYKHTISMNKKIDKNRFSVVYIG